MKEIYHPYFPVPTTLIVIISCFFSLKLYFSWENSGSLLCLFSAIFFLLVFMLCSIPLIEWKRIEIENGYIIIYKRFYKPLKINICESLYQVTMKDKIIRSFHFRGGKYEVQVSPVIYKNGYQMAKTVTDYIKKHKIIVNIVT